MKLGTDQFRGAATLCHAIIYLQRQTSQSITWHFDGIRDAQYAAIKILSLALRQVRNAQK